MPLFKVTWSKAYYRNGETIIDASTFDEAMDLADQQIGNWEGSLQYCPDDNQIDIDAVDPEEHLTADQLREAGRGASSPDRPDSAPLTPNEVLCYRELFHLFDQSEEWGGDVLEEVSGIFSRYGIKLTDHTECTDKDEES